MHRVRFMAALTVVAAAGVIATLLPPALAQKSVPADQPDLAVDEPENPHRMGYRTASYALQSAARNATVPREDRAWESTYQLWQDGISYTSALGTIAPAHGREDVRTYAEAIHAMVSVDLELLTAAAIAHQASDVRDRPFGTDLIEEFWLQYMNANASVGIAQLRPEEVRDWAPELVGQDLLAPEIAIRVMAAKLDAANQYIERSYTAVDPTDRYMLLAIVQNTSRRADMRGTIDYFFRGAKRDWDVMLTSAEGQRLNWRKQLRLVLLHADWLLEQGWRQPDGLDRDRWAAVAFSTPAEDALMAAENSLIRSPNRGR